MGSGATVATQWHNDDDEEDGVVSSTVGTDNTMLDKGAGDKRLEVNGVIYSVVSEEATEDEEEQKEDQQDVVEMNVDNTSVCAGDEQLDMEAFDHVQEEGYETAKETENTIEESSTSSNSNNTVDNVVNTKERQKQVETISGGQDFEQSGSIQSSQPSSLSSSSYYPSPVVDKTGARVSVHREFDANYERPTDNGNVRLYHVMIM